MKNRKLNRCLIIIGALFLFINYSITANLLIVKSESYNSVSNRADFSSDVIYQIITDRFSDGDESNNPKGEIFDKANQGNIMAEIGVGLLIK